MRQVHAAEQAVEIRRTLVKARPDAFPPDLGMGFGAIGSIHHALGEMKAARQELSEGIAVLAPRFETIPQALARRRVQTLVRR